MNAYGYSRGSYTNPYTDRRYGPALSATQGFLNSYMQQRQYLQNEQYRQSLLDLQKKRAGLEERRVDIAGRKLELSQLEPEKYSTPWFEGLGYSPEVAQKLQDIQFGAQPKPATPTQQLTAGKIMVENALTTEQLTAGEELMNDAMEAIRGQRAAFKPDPNYKLFDREDTEANQVSDTDLQGMPTLEMEISKEPTTVDEFMKIVRKLGRGTRESKTYFEKWKHKF